MGYMAPPYVQQLLYRMRTGWVGSDLGCACLAPVADAGFCVGLSHARDICTLYELILINRATQARRPRQLRAQRAAAQGRLLWALQRPVRERRRAGACARPPLMLLLPLRA